LHFSLTKDDLVSIGAIPDSQVRGRGRIDYQASASWRKWEGSDAFASDLWEIISRGRLKEAEIVVLPEYCVPLNVAKSLLGLIETSWNEGTKRKNRLLVLGSHLDERGYNTAPIVWVAGDGIQVFLQQKLYIAKDEKDEGIVSRRGTATYVFRTPSFGHISVLICRDGYESEPWRIRDIDAVLIPAFDDSSRATLLKSLEGKAHLNSKVVVFANGAKAVGSELTDSVILRGRKKVSASDGGVGERVGNFLATVLLEEVNLEEIDQLRVREFAPAAPPDVFPLHVDLWSDQEKFKEELKARLETVVNLVSPDVESVDEVFMIDWERVQETWKEEAVKSKKSR
jgi:predicted amidohydrolase